ncbi:hypothetical protein GCM10011583_66100 [Streptomyces camponoticapitis]|uniref:Uncharacterized protein n=1 Tax=Streptomyces camponoticapitis TaxID=1616125 RepID=A0ABQ2EWA3_9ACTN|nr:hypothetical protein [Streptomyces camponoticapitis]GGK24806.1 hypothetical protein GCM10011583_66100 [Streptomyces camponoticapitis]
MTEQPDQHPVQPRVDEAAADLGTMVELGMADPAPVPSPSIAPFLEPAWPPEVEPDPYGGS